MPNADFDPFNVYHPSSPTDDWWFLNTSVFESDDQYKAHMRAEGEAREKAQDEARQRKEQEAREYQYQHQTYGYKFHWRGFRESSWAPPPPPKMDGIISAEIDKKKLLELITLCHPDKHNNSVRATQITQWLLELKAKLETKGATCS